MADTAAHAYHQPTPPSSMTVVLERLRGPAIAAAVLALGAWAFWQRWRFLAGSPYPLGVDGYFYPIQLRSLLERGSLYYPSAPLGLWLMAPLAWLSDPITGAKLGAALGSALAVWPAYVCGRRIGGSWAAGALGALAVATSAESFYLTCEFVKNGIGLTLALGYLAVLGWALEAPSRKRAATALAMLLAVLATHKLAAILAIVATLPPLLVGWRAGVIGRRGLLRGLAAMLVMLVVAGYLAPDRFAAPGDVTLLRGLFAGRWNMSLPVLAPPHRPPLVFQHEVAWAGALSLAALLIWLAAALGRGAWLRAEGTRAVDRALVVGPALIAMVMALPIIDVSDPDALGFRLRLIAFVPLALAAAAVTGALLVRVSPLFRVATVLPFALAFLIGRSPGPREGVVTVHPAMQAAVAAAAGAVPASDVIIVPERHIAFMTAWYTRSNVRLRPEPVPPERRWRLMPMAFMSQSLRDAIDRARGAAPAEIPPPRSLHPGHRNGLVLMPEATWQWILETLPEPQRRYYQRWQTH